jgi:hypothetical protein
MSDQADCNIVVFVFLFSFFYLNYLRIKIDIKNDWENMRCNPMNLWTSSFFKDEATANSNFNKCINTMSADAINAGLQNAFDTQTKAMTQIANQERVMKNYLDEINININGTGGLVDQYKNNELKIDDIKQKQTTYGAINEVLTTKDGIQNNLFDFTNNVKNIFDNIKNYLPNLK